MWSEIIGLHFLFCLALALKGIEYEYRAVHLLKDGGEQVGVYEFMQCPVYCGHGVACVSTSVCRLLQGTEPAV